MFFGFVCVEVLLVGCLLVGCLCDNRAMAHSLLYLFISCNSCSLFFESKESNLINFLRLI
jgi:hypothetical protein